MNITNWLVLLSRMKTAAMRSRSAKENSQRVIDRSKVQIDYSQTAIENALKIQSMLGNQSTE
jgi:hypothetical protein